MLWVDLRFPNETNSGNVSDPVKTLGLSSRIPLFLFVGYFTAVSRDSAVGIATCNGLEGPAIESR
jgi:hypothetical protein